MSSAWCLASRSSSRSAVRGVLPSCPEPRVAGFQARRQLHAEDASYGIGRVHAQHVGDDEHAQDERSDGAGLARVSLMGWSVDRMCPTD
jgi:hypothetical protein